MSDDRPRGAEGAAKTKRCDICGWVYPWHECSIIVMSPELEIACLRALDAVTPTNPATVISRAEYDGISVWRTPDGWQLAIFNDCGEWDYVQYVVTPDGVQYDFPVYREYMRPDFRAATAWVARWAPLHENIHGWPHAAEDMSPDPRPTEVEGRPYPLINAG